MDEKQMAELGDAFADYLPLTAVRTAPGEYDITDSTGRVLWRMEGASLAEWVCASANRVPALDSVTAWEMFRASGFGQSLINPKSQVGCVNDSGGEADSLELRIRVAFKEGFKAAR